MRMHKLADCSEHRHRSLSDREKPFVDQIQSVVKLLEIIRFSILLYLPELTHDFSRIMFFVFIVKFEVTELSYKNANKNGTNTVERLHPQEALI